jgi:hypothetical protein
VSDNVEKRFETDIYIYVYPYKHSGRCQDVFDPINLMSVDPCIIVKFVKRNRNKLQKCFKSLLLHIYIEFNMIWATLRPSSGALNCTGTLWFFLSGRLLDVELVDVVRQVSHVSRSLFKGLP